MKRRLLSRLLKRKPNLFIGNVAVSVPDLATLAVKLSLTKQDIYDFKIDSNGNISCYVAKEFWLISDAFRQHINPTYFLDLDMLCVGGYGKNHFRSNTRNIVLANNFNVLADIGVNIFGFSEMHLLCINNMIPLGSSTEWDSTFYGKNFTGNVYVNIANETINEGLPDGDITGSSPDIDPWIKYATDFTRPEAPTNITTISKTELTIEVGWDAVSHVNDIDYYLIFVDRVYVGRTATNSFVIEDLVDGEYYSIEIITIDEMGNYSYFSEIYKESTEPIDLDSFITTWETTSPDESITIPTASGGYNYRVDWGDGTVTTGHTGDATHTYAVEGVYTVKISGDFPRIYFNGGGDNEKILTIEQWGSQLWTSMGNAFFRCRNLTIPATDAPNLSIVTDLGSCFQGCWTINSPINHWNTSNVQTMFSMFRSATLFNQDLSSWNIEKVQNLAATFQDCPVFDQDLSNWKPLELLNATNFLNGATLSTTNYDALLNGWASQAPNIKSGVVFHGGNSKYSPAASAARANLVSTYGWTIVDGGAV